MTLRDPQGWYYTAGALAYICVMYALGWWSVFQDNIALNSFGVIALAHSMVIASYLLHDCGHNAVFVNAEHNTKLGYFLNAIAGSKIKA